MNNIIFAILTIGFSGLVAQSVLLRELLVGFNGNELTIGLILANWVLAEAAGVFIAGKLIDKAKQMLGAVVILQVVFLTMFPAAVYLSRTFKYFTGLPYGEGVGLYTIFLSSLIIIFPVSFSHGALFSVCSKLFSTAVKDPETAIGRVYAWETIGTVIGGVVLTCLFIPFLNSFQVVFIIAAMNLFICLLFFKGLARPLKVIVIFLIITIGYFSFSGGISRIQRSALNKAWGDKKVLDYRNSVYGNIAVTKEGEQYTFFYNGIPVITAPYPDKQFVQEFGNLPLLFHRSPEDVLIISGGAGGVIGEIIKHPVRKLDYVEIDPLIISMLKEYRTDPTEKELSDSRLNLISSDGRFFLRHTLNKYDVILIGLSRPSDLTTNRFFTGEFFALTKLRLKQGGILAFSLPGSLTYLSPELRDLNACILKPLKDNYGYIKVIPGERNLIFASDSGGLLEVDAQLLIQRIRERGIRNDILVPAYLEYRLNKETLAWFRQSLKTGTQESNRDLRPLAVFQMLIYFNKQFSPFAARVFERIKGLTLKAVAGILALMTMILFFWPDRQKKFSIPYSIFTTGFFGMLSTLILVSSFQVYYGYLYYLIGMLLSVFMAAAALGSIYASRQYGWIKNNSTAFVKNEAVMVVFSLFISWLIPSLAKYGNYAVIFFISLLFICGFLVGLAFALAGKISLAKKERAGSSAGILYGADLMGGWLAGITGGIILLPVLGFVNSCFVIAFLKSSSMLLLIRGKRP